MISDKSIKVDEIVKWIDNGSNLKKSMETVMADNKQQQHQQQHQQ